MLLLIPFLRIYLMYFASYAINLFNYFLFIHLFFYFISSFIFIFICLFICLFLYFI